MASTALYKSPISILYPDVLHSIFMYDTYTDPGPYCHQPLTTIRYASQVCSHWREIIVHSPLLWANMICVHHLRSPKWREQVMRRTGNAPLSIHGWLTRDDMAVLDVWLDRYWGDRIRALHVWCADRRLYNDRIWQRLSKPSRVLEIFYFGDCPGYYKEKENARLIFGNQAPRLKEFFCPGYYPDVISTQWPHTLRLINLDFPLGIVDLLRTLSLIPTLESVLFYCWQVAEKSKEHSTQVAPIRLPRLTEIIMCRSNIDWGEEALFLLRNIIPAPRCTLDMHPIRFRDTPQLSEYQSVVSRYVQNACGPHGMVRSLSVFALQGAFTLKACTDMDQVNRTQLQRPFIFRLTIRERDITNYNALFSRTLFPFLQFHDQVTTLDFILERSNYIEMIQDDIKTMTRLFVNVTTLRANEAALSFLIATTYQEILVPFPNLERLQFFIISQFEHVDHIARTVLSDFLRIRWESGYKSDLKVNLTEYSSWASSLNQYRLGKF